MFFAGALLTSYSGIRSLKDFFIPGVGLVAINCLGAATATVIVRAKVNNLTPEILSFNRTFWLLIFFSGWIIIIKPPLIIPTGALVNTIIAAMLGVVIIGPGPVCTRSEKPERKVEKSKAGTLTFQF